MARNPALKAVYIQDDRVGVRPTEQAESVMSGNHA
jgi:hypothetical protein